ncbi:MAG TPA: hypothetical protein DCZ92_13915 [Elusimicrobia bacterium]|nr:MAG: hypothetical protein A2016_05510 [Elusimicrobia bacterium GWF2_62_30]HBA61879.1 hypothetical protein [Elusimicrobiota bacterium]
MPEISAPAEPYVPFRQRLDTRILAALAVAFILRLAYALHSGDAFAYPDEAEYHGIALNLLAGPLAPDSFHNREPFYPLLVSLVYRAAGAHPAAVKLLQACLSMAGLYFIYGSARLLFNRRAAAIALLIAAFYPFSVFYDARLLRENLLFFWAPAIIFFSLRAFRLDGRCSYAAALFTGLAVLTKTIHLFYWPVFILAGLLLAKLSLKQAAFSTLILLAVLSPLLLFNYAHTGTAFLSRGQNFNLYQSLVLPDAVVGTDEEAAAIMKDPVFAEGIKLPPAAQDKYFSKATRAEIKARPGNFIHKTLWKFGKLWRPVPYKGKGYAHNWLPLALVSLLSDGWLLLLGLYAALKLAGRWRELLPVYAYVAVFTAIYSLSWSQIRYRLPLMPFFIIFAAFLIDTWLPRKTNR